VRASTIRTFDGAEVLIPNGTLISNDVVNWTLSDRTRRIEIPVGVAYGTDPSRALTLLAEVGAAHAAVMSRPAPQALFMGFGASSLDFVLRFWTAEFDDWVRIQSEVTVAIHDRLRDEGIEIPFPQSDLHLRTVTPAAVEALRRGDPNPATSGSNPLSDSRGPSADRAPGSGTAGS
jgi:small-conductance mechanosensitive channel